MGLVNACKWIYLYGYISTSVFLVIVAVAVENPLALAPLNSILFGPYMVFLPESKVFFPLTSLFSSEIGYCDDVDSSQDSNSKQDFVLKTRFEATTTFHASAPPGDENVSHQMCIAPREALDLAISKESQVGHDATSIVLGVAKAVATTPGELSCTSINFDGVEHKFHKSCEPGVAVEVYVSNQKASEVIDASAEPGLWGSLETAAKHALFNVITESVNNEGGIRHEIRIESVKVENSGAEEVKDFNTEEEPRSPVPSPSDVIGLDTPWK
jgi:hypothetical protein